MDITKSFRKLAISIRDNVEEENRSAVYLTMMEEFDECSFELSRLLDLDPYLDEVLKDMYPDEVLELEAEDEEDEGNPDGLHEVGVLDDSDESEDRYERSTEDDNEEW
jgi:hypothetical protein